MTSLPRAGVNISFSHANEITPAIKICNVSRGLSETANCATNFFGGIVTAFWAFVNNKHVFAGMVACLSF